jgi:tetratricopeptide (TPR) repeat protein
VLLTGFGGGGNEPAAPLFSDLGDHHLAISTSVPLAQRYFDQGLTLTYAFNHREAIRSFREAARLDPECAICWWGVALAYGPNINAPMTADAVAPAWEALQQAERLAVHASERERAYIEALAPRYAATPVADRSGLDRAYADAMRQLVARYPDDLDAATLFAEALMDLSPWSYWTASGQARPGTAELVSSLERVLARDTTHPGANHYYIHAMEASPHPERALPAARRLGALVPGSGHLVHMPAHIYLRLGLYHDAVLANQAAIRADESYVAQSQAQGTYPALYYPHNVHFLWYALAMEGQSAEAIKAAWKAVSIVREHAAHAPQMAAHSEWILVVPYQALLRFGKWQGVLDAPAPATRTPYVMAMWRFARGFALVRTGDTAAAERELDAVQAALAGANPQLQDDPMFPRRIVLRMAERILAAEIAGARGNTATRLEALSDALALEDALPYMEPPFSYLPTRHLLGKALLEAGRSEEAAAVYRDDLRRHPHNGWALRGLLQSLAALGEDTADVRQRLEAAWRHADVTPPGSAF